MSFKRFNFALIFCVAICAFAPCVVSAQENDKVTESDENWFYGKLIKSISFKNLKSVDSKENERLPIQESEWNIEYIGEHNFEQKTVVYKIVPEGGV